MSFPRSLGVAGFVAFACAAAAAGATEIQLQQALDQGVELNVTAPIEEVFERLSAVSGIDFVMTDQTLALLPYGDQTRLSVTLKNVTPRKALSAMLAPQALTWAISDGAVEIIPMESLRRMNRRANYEELRMLGIVHTIKLQPVGEGGSVIDQLRLAVGNEDMDIEFRSDADPAVAIARADKILPSTAAQWLDVAGGRQDTWFVQGNSIVIISRSDQVQRQLQRHVSLKYNKAALVNVLLDLSSAAGIRLLMEPDVMNNLPIETRKNFNLAMADASVAQALEVISGATGLEFVATDDGIRVSASEELKLRRQAAAPMMPFFVRMAMPQAEGATVEVFFRSDELPKDVVEAIEADKARMIQSLRRLTTTAPADGN